MTRPTLPPKFDIPESTVSDLHALYREGSAAEPSLQLDRSILAAARDALQADAASKSRPHRPWWKGWLTAAPVIAVAVLGLSVTLRVMDEQERQVHEEVRAAQGATGAAEGAGSAESAGSTAPARRSNEAQPAAKAPALKAMQPHPAESPAALDAPAAKMELAAPPAAAVEPRPFTAQQNSEKKDAAVAGAITQSMPAPQTPAAPAAEVAKSRRGDLDELRERRDANASFNAGSGLARPSGKAEAQSLGASAEKVADSAAKPADDAATPEAWLKHIRKLRADGRNTEAVQSLARLRARYPDLVLPEDLLRN